MLGAFVCWICVCVFVASYLRGYQAYAAVLSGYTVAIIALVNIDTPLAHIHVGDPVEATLLGFQDPIKGRIESITGGISAANAASSTQGLPNVDPIFTWVRLAQRIPVRVRIEQIPPEVLLVAGMTCSVSVVGGEGMPVARRDRGLFYRLENLL
jgi:multidrug resistance efflux pump